MYNAWLQKISEIMTSKPALWCVVCQKYKTRHLWPEDFL